MFLLPSLFCVAAFAAPASVPAPDALAAAAAARLPAARAPLPARFAAPSDPALYFSPYNWLVNGTSASTINSAAYMRVLFQGPWANLSFDVSQMVQPPSQVYVQIDNGPRTPFLVAPLLALPVPFNLTRGDVPWHTLELFVKSTTETANRWGAVGPSTRVVFTGLSVSGGLSPWLPALKNVLIYGDSITEGVLTLGGSQHCGLRPRPALINAFRSPPLTNPPARATIRRHGPQRRGGGL